MNIPTRTFLDDFSDWTYAHGALGAIAGTGALLLGGLLIAAGILLAASAIYGFFNRGRETITLYADEWEATESHEEIRSEYNVALKMPTTRRVTVVNQWTRRR